MRVAISISVALLSATPVAATEKYVAFIDMCKQEVKGDVTDRLGLRQMNIDPAGFCVCVGFALEKIVSHQEVIEMAGKPLTEAFIGKLEAAQGLNASSLRASTVG